MNPFIQLKTTRAFVCLVLLIVIPVLSEGADSDVFKGVCSKYRWYPADADTLSTMVDGFMSQADSRKTAGGIFGLISPHAGYAYSGPVAGVAYRSVKGKSYERAVIIGPFHGLFNKGLRREEYVPVSVLDMDAFETPLGAVRIDRKAARRLIDAHPKIRASTGMFYEHSVESQIPFVQRALPGVPILPIVMGQADLETARWLAPVLKTHLSDVKTLFIASSDLSHFHSYKECNRRDAVTLDLVKALDLEGIDTKVDGSDMCGRGAVLTLLELFKNTGGGDIQVLDHKNSGDTSGDKSRVVGYAAVALSRKAPQDRKEIPAPEKGSRKKQ
ncbi:AmmeMemoRadiSam system protein B [Acidobacteriota bacterium]